MSIEELVKKYSGRFLSVDGGRSARNIMCDAITEQAEAYEQRIAELTGVRLTVGDGLEVYGTGEAIRRAQAYILMDSSHPIEAKSTARHFASALQVAEARIREFEAQLDDSREREGRMRALVEKARRAIAWNISNHDAKVSADLYEEFDRALAAIALEDGES